MGVKDHNRGIFDTSISRGVEVVGSLEVRGPSSHGDHEKIDELGGSSQGGSWRRKDEFY